MEKTPELTISFEMALSLFRPQLVARLMEQKGIRGSIDHALELGKKSWCDETASILEDLMEVHGTAEVKYKLSKELSEKGS